MRLLPQGGRVFFPTIFLFLVFSYAIAQHHHHDHGHHQERGPPPDTGLTGFGFSAEPDDPKYLELCYKGNTSIPGPLIQQMKDRIQELDCGNDLHENITCQLKYNDRIRGQCRGGVAYPCGTLRLAPGMHDQTCVSGYCNMEKNICEDFPPPLHRHSRATTIGWKLNDKEAVYEFSVFYRNNRISTILQKLLCWILR